MGDQAQSMRLADMVGGDQDRHNIHVQRGEALIAKHKGTYVEVDLTSTGTRQSREDVSKAREWICRNCFDIRISGAVMSVTVNEGQVRRPLQLTFVRSIEPVISVTVRISPHELEP